MLYVFLACIATVAIVRFARNRVRSSNRWWVLLVGSVAVLSLELMLLHLVAETGDHFDAKCMQAGLICTKRP